MKYAFCFQPQEGNSIWISSLASETRELNNSHGITTQTLDNRQCRIMLLQWREQQGEPRNPLIFWLEAISTLQVQGGELRYCLQKHWTENTGWLWGGPGGYILWDGVLKRREIHRKFQNCVGIHLSWTPIWACIGWNPQAWQRTTTYKLNNCQNSQSLEALTSQSGKTSSNMQGIE